MGCMYRLGEEEDIPVLLCLIRELTILEEDFEYNPKKYRDGLRLLMSEDSERATVIVAESEGSIVGMCTGQVVTSTAIGRASVWIEDVVVAAKHRGKGVGKGLLYSVEHWAKEFVGAGRVQLVSDKNNANALNFCRKLDWYKSNLVVLKKVFA